MPGNRLCRWRSGHDSGWRQRAEPRAGRERAVVSEKDEEINPYLLFLTAVLFVVISVPLGIIAKRFLVGDADPDDPLGATAKAGDETRDGS